ncbi:hypothetical protein ACT4US_36245, partial [Bacillus sp. HC-Mk]
MIENQVKKKRRRIFLFSIIALLLVCGSVYAYISSALGPVDSGNKKEIEVEIPKGSSTAFIEGFNKYVPACKLFDLAFV